MRLHSCVRIGALGAFALAAAGCSGGSPSQAQGDLPAAVVGDTAHAAISAPAAAARRSGSARPAIAACTGTGAFSFVGGTNGNAADGFSSGVLSGSGDDACDYYSGIGVGQDNVINSSGMASGEFIGGGGGNAISGGSWSFIGAGESNAIKGGFDAFIGGGNSNSVSAQYATLTGGSKNTVSGQYGFVGGGSFNSLSGLDGVVAGGTNNTLSAELGTISGGHANQATGEFGVVPGGELNVAAGYGSFAAGIGSYAANTGVFVWSDALSGAMQLKSSASNQFLARATGGVKFFSNGTLSTGVSLAPGGGSWASVSDRAVKTDIMPIDDATILDRVAAMPISEWSYISERGVRHVGPMAQDFYAAFGIGEDDKHITTIDEDGVALAAIKALHRQVADLKAQLHAIRMENARFNSAMTDLNQLRREVATLRRGR